MIPQGKDSSNRSTNVKETSTAGEDESHDECIEHLPAICCIDSEGRVSRVLGKGYSVDLQAKCKLLPAKGNSLLQGGDVFLEKDQMFNKLVDVDLNSESDGGYADFDESSVNHGEQYVTDFYLHVRSRHLLYYKGEKVVFRDFVSDSLVLWNNPWPEYAPPCFQLDASFFNYTDPNIDNYDDSTWFSFNSVDKQLDKSNNIRFTIDRTSCMGVYLLDDKGRPMNPMGRTGLCGRGLLQLWGPNHIRQYLITRPTEKNGYEFVSVYSPALNRWLFPEGNKFEDMGVVSDKVAGRFAMELVCRRAMGILRAQKAKLDQLLKFRSGTVFYSGYLDDSRNTDNAWIEVDVVSIHDKEQVLEEFNLDDPRGTALSSNTVSWISKTDERLHESCKDLLVAYESKCNERFSQLLSEGNETN
ncbi:hypothetical protein ACOME3_006956 [Neoechinorhynchus agilis]